MIKPKVILENASHKNANIVKILFEKNDEVLSKLKKLSNLKWSQTQRSWYVPYQSSW